MKPSVLAIVPARAHSKRIPGKNKKIFMGKPLIDWSIDAALSSGCVTDVYVTTDDEDILQFKTHYPSVHFVNRPAELAVDSTPGVEPVLHLMNQIGRVYDYVLLLQPTSPLRDSEHIDAAFKTLLENKAPQIVSVKKMSDTLGHIVYKTNDGLQFLKNNISEKSEENQLKVLNGAIYISEWKTLLTEKTFLGKGVSFFEMDELSSVDIDFPDDWQRAERYASMKVQ
ncbi:MAG: acylneuraminate cytidylyltransferase family protein [Bdellovibrio sp.]|nr:acylneuraminate cytidylyltransferase family protein [Bdellovibrio sp.]